MSVSIGHVYSLMAGSASTNNQLINQLIDFRTALTFLLAFVSHLHSLLNYLKALCLVCVFCFITSLVSDIYHLYKVVLGSDKKSDNYQLCRGVSG